MIHKRAGPVNTFLNISAKNVLASARLRKATVALAPICPRSALGFCPTKHTTQRGPYENKELTSGILRREVATVLLIAAGLLLRTFAYLRNVDPGFSGRNVLACHVIVPYAQYRTNAAQAAFFERVLERVRSLPGVRAAAAIDQLPVSGAGGGTWVHIEGKPEPPPGQQLNVMVRSVTPGYFAALGVPLYAGRDFTDADRGVLDVSKPIDPATSPLKLIVNQALVDRFLRGENALGRAWQSSGVRR